MRPRFVAVLSVSILAIALTSCTRSDVVTPFAGATGFSTLEVGGWSVVNAQTYPNGGRLKALGGYTNWSNTNGNDWASVKPRLDKQAVEGARPVLSWGSGAGGSNAAIAAGSYDWYVNQWAGNFKTLPYTVVIRLDWEENGFWYPWATGGTAPASAHRDYVAMWRHVHDVFAANGVRNVKWFFSPNTTGKGSSIVDFTPDYPGDAYVDYVGFDLYNWGTYHAGNKWKSFTDLATYSYGLMNALTAKPQVLGEVGSCDTIYNGGATGPTSTKEGWITSAFLTEIPQRFPRIVAFMWFNADKPGECNFAIDSTPATLAAFQHVAASPLWQANFP